MLKVIYVFVLLMPQFSLADQKVIPNYYSARNILWEQVYQKINKEDTVLSSLYCQKKPVRSPKFQLDHIVAASWMKKSAGCGKKIGRSECRRKSPRFRHMESDLHNLYAVESWANQKRGNAVFTDIKNHFKPMTRCYLQIEEGHIEPRDGAKGIIARALLYFEKEYQWDMNKETKTEGLKENMILWHCQHPPKEGELRKHDLIEKIQKTSNPYILNPNLECS